MASPTASSRCKGCSVLQPPKFVKSNLLGSNNLLESRMREIRQSGSEGRKAELNQPSLPRSSAAL